MAWPRKSFALLLVIAVSKVSAQHEAVLRGHQSETTFSKKPPNAFQQALDGECEDGDPCLALQVEREARMAADEALAEVLQQEVMGLSEADSSVQDSIAALKEDIDRKLQMLTSAAGTYEIVGENVTITIDLDKRCSRDKVDIGKGEEVSQCRSKLRKHRKKRYVLGSEKSAKIRFERTLNLDATRHVKRRKS